MLRPQVCSEEDGDHTRGENGKKYFIRKFVKEYYFDLNEKKKKKVKIKKTRRVNEEKRADMKR